MGKFQLRKPRIISKNFPEVGSHIDNVSKSLNDLVFSYSAQVDKALQKKHMMMALSTLVLILVVGNFISPKGKADIATFYPDTCLGGWSNPQNAQKEPQTSSNADPSQFDDKNSAILDKNTHADIYCGNFNGTFDEATQPTKIIVSFAMINKDEITIGATTTLEAVAASTGTSTEVTSSSTESLQLATSTETIVSSTSDQGSLLVSTGTQSIATTTEGDQSFVGIVTGAVTKTLSNLFNASTPNMTETDTVVIPTPSSASSTQDQVVPVQQAVPTDSTTPGTTSPTSYLDNLLKTVTASFVATVFAQEDPSVVLQLQNTVVPTDQSLSVPVSTTSPVAEVVLPDATSVIITESSSSNPLTSTTEEVATTSVSTTTDNTMLAASSSLLTDIATTTSSAMTVATDTQNNFLEVLYTFDGVTWVSLGELNEISMKYRTFEIPLSASPTWSDMSRLQIKVTSKSIEKNTPVVYLDAIKVEVLYESSLAHAHPDFVRDTILKDETVDGMRLVTIINNETNEEEIWYMYLDDTATSSVITSSSTDVAASSTLATSTVLLSTSSSTDDQTTSTTSVVVSSATSTDDTASTSSTSVPIILPTVLKNKWFKLEKKEGWKTLSAKDLVAEIKKQDKAELDKKSKLNRLPDPRQDLIKKIKGTFLGTIVVQIEKEGVDELWLYDVASDTPMRIADGVTTTIATDSPIGLKENHIFWVATDYKTAYSYYLSDNTLQSQPVPQYDISRGERARMTFDGIHYDVILGADGFVFSSLDTGEVFSDENGAAADDLRRKLNLDKILNPETISGLNLSVDASATSTMSDQTTP